MASRAIIRSGSGHKYWKAFDEKTQKNIQDLAKEINEYLFTPEIKTPIKTLDLPLAGKGYSSKSLPLIFDLVKLANNVDDKKNDDDNSGKETINYLTNTAKIIRRLTTTHPSSLGLHPAVYFYSEKGRYQITAFMAWIEIIKIFEKTPQSFKNFIQARENFEEYLIKYKYLTNQVTVKFGSGLKGYKQLKELYINILECITNNLRSDEVSKTIKQKYPYLNFDYLGEQSNSVDFNSSTKSEIFISKALESAPKCSICKGYIHVNSITIDHIQRKQDGGKGIKENGQIAHPYCNTTYKN